MQLKRIFFKFNPLDEIKVHLEKHNIDFGREEQDELIFTIEGKWTPYNVLITWQEEQDILLLTCISNLILDKESPHIYEILSRVNRSVFMGNFYILENYYIAYRYSIPLRGTVGKKLTEEQIEDIIDIMLGEYELYYSLFYEELYGAPPPSNSLELSLLDPIGEA